MVFSYTLCYNIFRFVCANFASFHLVLNDTTRIHTKFLSFFTYLYHFETYFSLHYDLHTKPFGEPTTSKWGRLAHQNIRPMKRKSLLTKIQNQLWRFKWRSPISPIGNMTKSLFLVEPRKMNMLRIWRIWMLNTNSRQHWPHGSEY